MRIVFENEDYAKKTIAETSSADDARKIMKKYLKDHGFHSPYWRMTWFEDERRIWIDFGSHVCFMHVLLDDNDSAKDWLG